MDRHKLENLIQRNEQPKLDFKANLKLRTDSEKKELAKDVIAIANSKGGRGYIIYGIEDKTKRVIGIDEESFREESIQQIINHRSNPPIPVSVEVIDYDDKQVAVLTVYKSNSRPHQMVNNGAFYVRRGSTTDVCRREELARMFQEYGLLTYEKVVLHGVGMNALDAQLLEDLLPVDELLLENLDIIKELKGAYHPTVGGMLLFGKNPIKYLSHMYIEFICQGQRKILTGSIIPLLEKVEEELNALCNDDDYPMKALFDVIANAVIHRDYIDYTRGITVEITHGRIYVTNPGALVAGNKVYGKHAIHHPKRRNPWLYQRVLMIDKGKRFSRSGLGLQRIRDAFKAIGEVKYINLDSDNLFKVILPSFKQY